MGVTSKRRSLLRTRRGHLRAGWRIAAWMAVVGVLLAALAALWDVLSPMLGEVRPDEGLASWRGVLACTLHVLVLILGSWIVLRFIDRRPFGLLGLAVSRRTVTEILQGAVIGGGAITVSVVAMWAAGAIAVEPAEMSRTSRGDMARVLLTITTAATMEELMIRGYAFQAAAEGIGGGPAAVVTSLIFGASHLCNTGATVWGLATLGASGALLSIAYLRTRSLYLPIAIHASWNWVQGCVWGSRVSGGVIRASLLRAVPLGPAWLSGGSFGAEGSVLAFMVVAAAAIYVGTARWVRPSEKNRRLCAPYPLPVRLQKSEADHATPCDPGSWVQGAIRPTVVTSGDEACDHAEGSDEGNE